MTRNMKKWDKPLLIVLAKGTPEESVLTGCKTMNPNQPFTGPEDVLYQDTCAFGADKKNCANCQARGVGGS